MSSSMYELVLFGWIVFNIVYGESECLITKY